MFHRYIFFVRACSWFIYILSIRVHIFCRTSIRSTCGFYKEKYSLYLQGRLLEQWWTWEVGHACTQRANTHIDFRWHAGAHMDVKIFFCILIFCYFLNIFIGNDYFGEWAVSWQTTYPWISGKMQANTGIF